MTEHPNVVRVRRLYGLGSSGDWDVLADSFAEDICGTCPVAERSPVRIAASQGSWRSFVG